MTMTGWMGEESPAAAPGLPLTDMLLSGSRGEPQPGAVLEQALARSRAAEVREAREAAESAPDADERAAAMVVRGLAPGMISQLSQRLASTEGELEAERQKIDRYHRREQQVMRMHAGGQIHAMQIHAMLGDDEGDASRAAMLERRRDGLLAQLATAQEAMSPPQAQRSEDPVTAALSRAHAAFVENTRQQFAALSAPQTVRSAPAPRPFAGVAVDGDDELATGCGGCVEVGATRRESRWMHADAPDMPRTSSAGMITR